MVIDDRQRQKSRSHLFFSFFQRLSPSFPLRANRTNEEKRKNKFSGYGDSYTDVAMRNSSRGTRRNWLRLGFLGGSSSSRNLDVATVTTTRSSTNHYDASSSRRRSHDGYSSKIPFSTSPWRIPYRDIKALRKLLMKANLDIFDSGFNCVHIACIEGLSPKVIGWMLSESHMRSLAVDPDTTGKLPIHHIVISVCEGKVSLENGLEIIDMLLSVQPTMIHHGDNNWNSPIDLIIEGYRNFMDRELQKTNRGITLDKLSLHLRKIGIDQYRQQKKRCEETMTNRARVSFVPFDTDSYSLLPVSDDALFQAGQTVCTAESLYW